MVSEGLKDSECCLGSGSWSHRGSRSSNKLVYSGEIVDEEVKNKQAVLTAQLSGGASLKALKL